MIAVRRYSWHLYSHSTLTFSFPGCSPRDSCCSSCYHPNQVGHNAALAIFIHIRLTRYFILSTRLTKDIVNYIIDHSGAKFILVDYEYANLVEGSRVPVVICRDTGRADDPYEQFLGSCSSSKCVFLKLT